MDAGLNWLWQGCVVALVVAGMLRLLERASANVRYVVCWAALFLTVALPALSWLRMNAPRPDLLPPLNAPAVVSVPDTWWMSGELMVIAWTAWASVSLVRLVMAIIDLRRARRRSQPFPSAVESALCHWRQVQGDGQRPTLVVSDAVSTAAVLGCGAPMIAVAPSLLATLTRDDLDRVLIHEWAHVQRRDHRHALLQIGLRIIAGWHPAVWWIERRLQIERESACDEMTVAVTGSPKSYATCLVKLAGLTSAPSVALAGPAALGTSGLRLRVTRIVSRHILFTATWSRGLAAGIVSTLCLVSFGVGGLRLVEVTAFALPFDSIRRIEARMIPIPPIASPIPNVPVESRPPERTAAMPLREARQVAIPSRPADRPAPAPEPEGQALPETAGVAAPAEPQASPAGTTETAAASEPQSAAPPTVAAARGSTAAANPALWTIAADSGTALGRKSKDAGVATGRFFTRVAKRVAGTF